MFFAVAPRASFVDGAITMGISFLSPAFTAIVTEVSVMPRASFDMVFPVQGATTMASKSFFGPMGSASGMVVMGFLAVTIDSLEKSSSFSRKRVEVFATIGERMGVISYLSGQR